MTAALWALSAVLIAPTPQEGAATTLVARLGSAEPDVRDRAAEALKALGRDALPALEAALKSDDPTRRERASALWDAIQRDRMTQPTLVRLEGAARPRSEALDEIARQSGVRLRGPHNAQDGVMAAPHPAPVPFWEALRGLGISYVFHQSTGQGGLPELNVGEDQASPYLSVSGPFRVALNGLHLHYDRHLIGGPWAWIDGFGQRRNMPASEEAGAEATFYGDLQLMVEPRMWFTQEDRARLVEAVDDLGQSLVPEPDDPAQRLRSDALFAPHANNGITQATVRFRLRVPEKLARTARLRGVVPVMLHLRRPEPALVVPLADAVGKTFRSDDAEFTIDKVSDGPKSTYVATTVRLVAAGADLPDDPARELLSSRLHMWGRHQLQLVAADGTVLADGASSGGGSWDVYRWNISTSQVGGATHLRVYTMLRVRAEAAFDFQGVPLP